MYIKCDGVSVITFICILTPPVLALWRLVARFVALLVLVGGSTLAGALGGVCAAVDTAAGRLTVSAALPWTPVVFTTPTRLLGLFHLHLNIGILLRGERYPVLLLELAQHMLCIAFLRVYLAALNHLLDLLDQDWPLLVVWNFKCTLYHIVGELVVDHLCKRQIRVSHLHTHYSI